MNIRLIRPLAPLTLAVALMLSACSGGESATFEDDAPGQSQQDQDDQTRDDQARDQESPEVADENAGDDDDVTRQSAAEAGVDPQALGEPIATVTVPASVSRDPDATMDVSIHELRRDGETLIGIFSFHVHSTQQDEARWIYHYLSNSAWRPHLIDSTNLARHDVLSTSGFRAMTSYQGVRFRPGQTVYGYAAFAAPPADVTSMAVQITGGTAPVTVEIEQ